MSRPPALCSLPGGEPVAEAPPGLPPDPDRSRVPPYDLTGTPGAPGLAGWFAPVFERTWRRLPTGVRGELASYWHATRPLRVALMEDDDGDLMGECREKGTVLRFWLRPLLCLSEEGVACLIAHELAHSLLRAREFFAADHAKDGEAAAAFETELAVCAALREAAVGIAPLEKALAADQEREEELVDAMTTSWGFSRWALVACYDRRASRAARLAESFAPLPPRLPPRL